MNMQDGHAAGNAEWTFSMDMGMDIDIDMGIDIDMEINMDVEYFGPANSVDFIR
jgi:hypothetical protein